MLRYSLYKKFVNGGGVDPEVEKIQPKGITAPIPTMEEYLSNNQVFSNTGSYQDAFQIPNLSLTGFKTSDSPEGTVTDKQKSYKPGTFKDEGSLPTFTSMLSPLNPFDVNQKTPEVEQGPLSEEEATMRGIQTSPIISSPKDQPSFWQQNSSALATLGLLGVDSLAGYNEDLKNKSNFNESIQQRNSKPVYDYNYMYGRTTSGGTEYQPTIKAEMGAKINKRYASGGMNDVEIEGGEYIQLPNLDTEMAEGPSHSNGGIPTNLPNETRVYSNNLKPEGSKKTFAQIAKNYDTTSYKKTLENPFAKQVDKDTASLMMKRNQKVLDDLFEDQQIMNGNSNGELEAKRGASINNPGFKVLPGYVQAKITANMADGAKYKVPQGVTVKQAGDPSIQVGDYVMGANNKVQKVTAANKKTTLGEYNKGYDDLSSTLSRPEFDKVKEAMYTKYKEKNPSTTVSKDQFIKNFMDAQKQIYTIREAAKNNPNLDIKTEDLDRTAGGMKNKVYNQIAKQLGFNPLTEDQTKMFQQSYLDLADLQNNPEFKETLSDFDLTPTGMTDDMYLGKPISKADAIFGNTTIGQAVRAKSRTDAQDYTYEDVPLETKDIEFNQPGTAPRGTYTPGKFPLYQAIPEAMGLAQSQQIYPYAIPEIDAPYLRPQTLNIQSELQNIDNMGTAAMRSGADPLDVYIAGIDAKQKAFQTKQNYDAEGRTRADMANAQTSMQADQFNAQAFDRVYNNLVGQARDAQSAEKQASIANMITKKGLFDQSESRKAAFINNLVPSFNTTSKGQMDVTEEQLPFYFNAFNNYVDAEDTKKKTAKKGMYKKPKY
jgi:hypothetical protein